MIFEVLTIFPELIRFYISESIIKRGIEKGLIEVNVTNIRDFTLDRHRSVDDTPYGGGPGMVMKAQPIYDAINFVKSSRGRCYNILLGPRGEIFNHRRARELRDRHERILLMCGRYEGVDERVKGFFDKEMSVGDYVLTGGELAALVVIDSVSRLVEGVLGNDSSSMEDSFANGILDYPHYTRPAEFMGMGVPQVILSGNHKEINGWRRRKALEDTVRYKPYLLEGLNLSEDDCKILKEIKEDLGDETDKRP